MKNTARIVILLTFLISNIAHADLLSDLYDALQASKFDEAKKLSVQILAHQNQHKNLDIDKKFPVGQLDPGTLLYYAAKAGQPEVVENLLKVGADPNSFNGKFLSTPLQSAANVGDIPSVQALIKAGARIGEKNSAQNTALHTAINNGKLQVLDALLQGAVRADLDVQDKKGVSPLQLAKNKNVPQVEARLKVLSLKNLKDDLLQRISQAPKDSTYLMDQVNLESLSKEDLTEVVNEACKNRQETNFSAKLCFDSRDQMIRLAADDSKSLTYFKNNCHDSLIQSLDFDKSQFHSFNSQGGTLPLKNSKLELNSKTKLDQKKLLVFHGSVSFHDNTGGMGAFLESFIHSQEKHKDPHGNSDLEGRELTAFYEFLKMNLFGPKTKNLPNDAFPLIRFAGFVEHEVDGKMRKSSVYEATTDGIRQYLIQTDPHYVEPLTGKRGSDILTKGRYDTYDETGRVYFSSAMAAAATLYCGENKNENVDVLMAHDRNMVMLPILMRLAYNAKREEAKLPKIPTISVIHTQNGLTYSKVEDTAFTRAGLRKPKQKSIPLFTAQAVFSDMTLAVSNAYANELSAKGPKNLGLGEMYSELKAEQLFGGITSGIETDRFSPTDSNFLGSVAVKSDLSDYTDKKALAKKELFKEKLIASETKPLALYVGRYDDIKGIDTLPAFAKLIVSNGGQVVIMGAAASKVLPPSIDEVIKMQSDPQYKNLIKVYTNYEKDQKAPLLSVGPLTKKGHLIRFASDFTFVPSVSEACGLVPIEANAMGNGLITSYVSGLQDLCKPINRSRLNGQPFNSNDFNCVAFDRSHQNFQHTIDDLKKNVENFLAFWDNLTDTERENHHKRWIEEAKSFSWNHPDGAMDQYMKVFLALQAPETSKQQEIRDQLIQKWVPLH